MTVLMVIVCVLNVCAFIIALIMFAVIYRLIKNGKSYDSFDAELASLRAGAQVNISKLVETTVVGGGSQFLVGTANSVFTRFGGPPDKFTVNQLLRCHQQVALERDTTLALTEGEVII